MRCERCGSAYHATEDCENAVGWTVRWITEGWSMTPLSEGDDDHWAAALYPHDIACGGPTEGDDE